MQKGDIVRFAAGHPLAGCLGTITHRERAEEVKGARHYVVCIRCPDGDRYYTVTEDDIDFIGRVDDVDR